MRRALLFAAALVAALGAAVPASGGGAALAAVEPLRLDAAAWYLVADDGAVLARHRSSERRAMASITKLMTALVTVERSSLSDVVTVPSRAAAVGGSTAFLRSGEQLTVAQLVRAMLVQSANDAAETLALHVGEGSVSAFVDAMNEKAAELGLGDTRFVNPHGLDAPGHRSSARDTTLLLRHALGVPVLRDALARTSVTLPGGRTFPAQDDLLASWPPLVGGKTGHTDDAGWSEVAAAKAKGVTVYGTVLGTDSREERNAELRALLRYGLERYHRVTAVDAGRVYAEAETGYGRAAVEIVAPRTLVRTVRDDASLVERVVVPESVGLPIEAGLRLGRVDVYAGSRLLASSDLVAARSVSEPGLLRKALWYAETTADNLWGLVT
jgi:D-alanyl-D-alanine carboxypeptidase (penicillin-binding protein 5/6)